MSRRDTPPARPPAPKLSLGKLSGRQNSTGSIAIHYNAASLMEEDDYNLDDDLAIGGNSSNVVQFDIGKNEKQDQTTEQHSKSAPASEVPSPVLSPLQAQQKVPSKHSPASEKGFIKIDRQDVSDLKETPARERSFISGIRERLSDKIPENLNAIIGKIEDQLSGDNTPDNGRERKLKKSESLDSAKNVKGGIERRESFLSSLKSHSRHSSVDSEHSNHSNSEQMETFGTSAIQDTKTKSHSNSFELVDDFFGEEPFEDFTGGASVQSMSRSSSKNSLGKSPSYEQLHSKLGSSPQKSKLGFQKFMKTKTGPVPGRPVSMTLSGLKMSNKGSDLEEQELVEAMEAEEFFDPPEESRPSPEQVPEQKEEPGHKSAHSSVPVQKIISTIVCIFAYLIIPMPTYMSGLVMGAALATLTIFAYQWFFAPPKPKPPFVLPELKTLPPLHVPEMKESRNDDGKFKGWMNELSYYNPDDYHINQTTSVYVHLDGTALRLQRPKHNIPKRAMWDEQLQTPTFIHQRHFELKGSKVYLLPHGLVKKRIWSKKYPITIALSKGGTKWEKTLQPQSSSEAESPQLLSSPGKDISNRTFDSVAQESCSDTLLYLFARTSREKEEWFHRLAAASEGLPLPPRISDLMSDIEPPFQKRVSNPNLESPPRHKRQGSTESVSSNSSDKDSPESVRPEQMLCEYLKYMSKIMPANHFSRSRATSPGGSRRDSANQPVQVQPLLCEPHLLWANSIIGRLFWDFLREPYWAEKMKDKIQRKLSKIHVPFFIDELLVTDIDLGNQIPTLRRSSRPYLDDRGLWLDMDVAYNGGFHMSLETKVNLMKLKKKHTHRQESEHNAKDKRSPITDSDEEDSAESSTDEEGGEENVLEPAENPQEPGASYSGSTGKKLLRLVDKVVASRYFQQATEYRYIKQAMEQVSNTPLQLSVELRCLTGTLAINVPPPPSDRIWYGFRTNPRLWLSAKPKVGERQVTVTHVTEWIEKKLSVEFQRVFVMPNMDDIPIPLMCDQPLEATSAPIS